MMGKFGKSAVPHLIKALGYENVLVRIGASRALGEIGPVADDAIPSLEAALQDSNDARLKKFAAEAIRRIKSK